MVMLSLIFLEIVFTLWALRMWADSTAPCSVDLGTDVDDGDFPSKGASFEMTPEMFAEGLRRVAPAFCHGIDIGHIQRIHRRARELPQGRTATMSLHPRIYETVSEVRILMARRCPDTVLFQISGKDAPVDVFSQVMEEVEAEKAS